MKNFKVFFLNPFFGGLTQKGIMTTYLPDLVRLDISLFFGKKREKCHLYPLIFFTFTNNYFLLGSYYLLVLGILSGGTSERVI